MYTQACQTTLSYTDAAPLLWELTHTYPSLHVQTIGSSAARNTLYTLSLGRRDAPTVFYCATDDTTAALLFQFVLECCTLTTPGQGLGKRTSAPSGIEARISQTLPFEIPTQRKPYRIDLPTLLRHRCITVCPYPCPDATDENWLCNVLGAFLPDYFRSPTTPEKYPEALALMQYLTYTEPALLCVLSHQEVPQLSPVTPHPIDRLLTRMLACSTTEAVDTNTALSAWYTHETGHHAYTIATPASYSALREFFYAAPLLFW